jgi:hypothetical protein
VGTLFSAFLGYNPIQTLLGPKVLGSLSAADRSTLTGKEFFPQLISQPFHEGLVVVFLAATIMTVIAAIASLIRGKKYVHLDLPTGSVDVRPDGTAAPTSASPAAAGSPVTASQAVRDA